MENHIKMIGIIGGTGSLGSGLAQRWLVAGHTIFVGSRTREKACTVVDEIRAKSGITNITGVTNIEAATRGEIIVLTVPFGAHQTTLEEIYEHVQGKIVLDTTVPLKPPRVARVSLPERGSAAAMTQDYLGEHVSVVSAFHTVSAAHLINLDHKLNGHVLICGNRKASRQIIADLIEDLGLKGWHAGSIENSAASEALTSTMIFINKFYQFKGAGIQIISEEY